jgi:ElaB/YqjD/DUF883 family membrane-anchored ribosome-binding protein
MTASAKSSPSDESGADIDKIKEDLATLRSDLAELVKGIKAGASDHMTKEASRIYDKLMAEGEHSLDAVTREVKERPLASLGIALVIGFICGRVLSR